MINKWGSASLVPEMLLSGDDCKVWKEEGRLQTREESQIQGGSDDAVVAAGRCDSLQ